MTYDTWKTTPPEDLYYERNLLTCEPYEDEVDYPLYECGDCHKTIDEPEGLCPACYEQQELELYHDWLERRKKESTCKS